MREQYFQWKEYVVVKCRKEAWYYRKKDYDLSALLFSKATPIMGKIKCLHSGQRIQCFERVRILPSSFSREIYDTAGIFMSPMSSTAFNLTYVSGSQTLLWLLSSRIMALIACGIRSRPYMADLSLIKNLVVSFLNHLESLGFPENWVS